MYLAYQKPQVPVHLKVSKCPGITNFKTYACAQRAAQLEAGNAQISRHPPQRGRDNIPNPSDALAA